MTRYGVRIAMLGVAALALAGALVAMPAQLTGAQEEGEYTVDVGEFWFGDSSFEGGTYDTEIEAGETVTWDFGGAAAPHTTTSDDGLWDSGTLNGGSFDFTFNEPGTYAYHCDIHPTLMNGVITVAAADDEGTDAPADDSTPVAGAQPTVSAPPNAGQGPGGPSGTTAWWLVAGLVGAAGMTLVGASTVMCRRSR